MPHTESVLNNIITGEIVVAINGKMFNLCLDDSPPCQGTGTWHQRPNALEKTGSFPGRLLFFNAFLLFFARFVWK